MKPQIKMIKTAALIPYVMNSRTHSEQQVAQIAASIKEFGFTNPILTDGENGIIAGHGRLLAAQKLELAEVPVIELSHLSDAQKRAYIIADNKLALNAGWDDDALRSELLALQDEDFNLELTGFSVEELGKIILPYDDPAPKSEVISGINKNTLLVSHDDEHEIQSLFEELRDRGYEVRVME